MPESRHHPGAGCEGRHPPVELALPPTSGRGGMGRTVAAVRRYRASRSIVAVSGDDLRTHRDSCYIALQDLQPNVV